MRNYPEITGKKPIYAAVFPAGSRYSVAPGVTRHTVLAFAEAAHDLVAQMFQKRRLWCDCRFEWFVGFRYRSYFSRVIR